MKKGLTELVFIIDRSGSMEGLESDTIGGFNAMLKEQKAVEGEAIVTTVLFDDKYELLHDRIDIKAVTPLTDKDYTVRGSTALLDALGKTIHKIRTVQKRTPKEDRAEKVLVVVITDGMENASRKYSAARIKKRIKRQKEKYGWEFVFFGANMDAVLEAGKLGIEAGSVHNYRSDSAGTSTAYEAISSISTAFREGKPFTGAATPKNTERLTEENITEVVDGLVRQMEADKDKTFTFNELMENSAKQKESGDMRTLREHLGDGIVFTGVLDNATEGRELEDRKLLPGELSAVVFTLGCYTVRSATRVYKIHPYDEKSFTASWKA